MVVEWAIDVAELPALPPNSKPLPIVLDRLPLDCCPINEISYRANQLIRDLRAFYPNKLILQLPFMPTEQDYVDHSIYLPIH
jgi:hypothetical protein